MKQKFPYPLLDEYRSGQETVKAFCERKGIQPWQYYYWRKRRLSKEYAEEPYPSDQLRLPLMGQ